MAAAVLESAAEVSPYETWCHPDYTVEDAADYVGAWICGRKDGIAFYYVVEDSTSGAMLGYWIRTSRTGEGIATTAARLVCAAAFEDLGLIHIEIGVPMANAASRRVAEKLGGARKGILRRKLILPTGPADIVLYGLFPEAFRGTAPERP